jgi:hypothetical protein
MVPAASGAEIAREEEAAGFVGAVVPGKDRAAESLAFSTGNSRTAARGAVVGERAVAQRARGAVQKERAAQAGAAAAARTRPVPAAKAPGTGMLDGPPPPPPPKPPLPPRARRHRRRTRPRQVWRPRWYCRPRHPRRSHPMRHLPHVTRAAATAATELSCRPSDPGVAAGAACRTAARAPLGVSALALPSSPKAEAAAAGAAMRCWHCRRPAAHAPAAGAAKRSWNHRHRRPCRPHRRLEPEKLSMPPAPPIRSVLREHHALQIQLAAAEDRAAQSRAAATAEAIAPVAAARPTALERHVAQGQHTRSQAGVVAGIGHGNKPEWRCTRVPDEHGGIALNREIFQDGRRPLGPYRVLCTAVRT